MRHVRRYWLGIFLGVPVFLASSLSFLQAQNTTASISLSPSTITTGQSAVLTWSTAGATACQGGGNPFINGWTLVQLPASGSRTVTQSSAGTYVYAVTCTGNGSTASASTTLTVTNPGSTTTITEAITGLPADITPMLSVAGVWQPVANQYLRSDGNGKVGGYFGNIRLANGREGLIATGWSCCGADSSKPITPVDIAILEQQSDGNLQLATSKYVPDAQTNGATIVLVADFNNDGVQDFFLPAYNESPFLPFSSTAYVSKADGTYTKITIGDQVEAHAATLAYVNGVPTVFTGGYYGLPNADPWNGSGFTVIRQTGIMSGLGSSSMAVGDFYGDGNYSEVYGDLPYPPGPNYVNGIYLYHLSGVLPTGNPVNVGDPYFNGKPEYAQYVSFTDPHGKTHSYRMWLDDFNHDGMLDIVVQGMIWEGQQGVQKTVLQMFQNAGNYHFNDVTDTLNPQYDKNATFPDYVPQVRDIDGSGVNSYLLGGLTLNWEVSVEGGAPGTKPAANYLIVNDGSGNLQVALHETLNKYGQQVIAWLTSNSSFNSYFAFSASQPYLRAYQTADGKLNFVAVIHIFNGQQTPPVAHQYVIVNIPLRLDLPSLFTKPMVVRDRNGSHLIRTFAGDDTIYSGNNGGSSKVDGGLGTNTLVYSGPSQNYSATHNADGTWAIKDNAGKDGTDTLTRIQRLQFTDIVVRLDTPTVVGPASSVIATTGTSQSTVVNTAFSTVLQVTVRDFLGNAVPNVTVTFTAPGSSSSGTFPGSALAATATTNTAGVATAPTFTANGTAGSYSITATVAGLVKTAAFTMTNRLPAVVSVSGANYSATLAPEAIASAFGTNLATVTQAATTLPLPVNLGGTSVLITDANGISRSAQLFFVSAGQVNYAVPPGVAAGTASITVSINGNPVAIGTANITAVAPGLFTASADGQGVPAAVVLRVKADGSQIYEDVAQFNGTQWVTRQIDLGPPGELVYLFLYGTGIRNRSSLSAVTATIGGGTTILDPAKFEYAGPAPGYVGLDQINVQLPRSLIGRGEVDLTLTADGAASNAVRIQLK